MLSCKQAFCKSIMVASSTGWICTFCSKIIQLKKPKISRSWSCADTSYISLPAHEDFQISFSARISTLGFQLFSKFTKTSG